MTQIVDSAITLGIPLFLAALGGLIAERAGVLNVALEGLMLGGAFIAAWAAGGGGSDVAGFAAAVALGAILGLAIGLVVVGLRADQVVVGIAFNIFMLGLTGYAYALVTGGGNSLDALTTNGGAVRIPGLASIPWFGVAFDEHWIAYLTYGVIPVTAFILFRTGAGIRLRACGEYAEGALASGVNVLRMRLIAVTISGAFAACAGAFMVLGDVHSFGDNMTSGRGYIALAVIILGRWRPLGAFLAAVLFGLADALNFYAQAHGLGVPLQLITATPYIVTLVAVTVLGSKVRPPAEDGQPLMLAR